MFLPEALHAYLVEASCREPELLSELREETAALPEAHFQIAPEQGQFLTFLLELIGARRCLDIGTFTGYSALVAALAMPPDGQVVTFDLSDRFTAMARRYWRRAGVAARIELRLGPAEAGLRALVEAGQAGSYDFAFIDADKERTERYFELALTLVRPGGVVAIDNTLWRGRVADPASTNPRALALRAFNHKLHGDQRVTPVLVPIGDGVTLARKRA